MSAPFPTRHGNWHMVNGELVDLDEQKSNQADDAPPKHDLVHRGPAPKVKPIPTAPADSASTRQLSKE